MSSPKEKTRKTYTRRAPKTKILDALQEIRDLVERHCGESQAAIQKTARVAAQEAVAAAASAGMATVPALPTYADLPATLAPNAAALPMPPAMMESASKRALVPNPSGPSEWNEFVQAFKVTYEAEQRAKGNDRKKIPYAEMLKAAKNAYAAKKASEGRAKPAVANLNAVVAPYTQRLDALNDQRRQLAAKIEVYKTAYPNASANLERMTKAIQGQAKSRADINAAINALRGKKLKAIQTKKLQRTLNQGISQMEEQGTKILGVASQLNANMATRKAAAKKTRRVSTMNNSGQTPREELEFVPPSPLSEEEELSTGSTNSSTGSSSSSNSSSTGSSSSSNNSSTGSSSSSNNSSTGSTGSSASTTSPPFPSLAAAASLRNNSSTGSTQQSFTPAGTPPDNRFEFKYNNTGANENTGTRKVTIKGKKYFMFPDGELIERDEEDRAGDEIVGIWKNGSIQPYVADEE